MTKQHVISIAFEDFQRQEDAIPQLNELFEDVSKHSDKKQGIHVICAKPINKTYDEVFEICIKNYVECGWIDPHSF